MLTRRTLLLGGLSLGALSGCALPMPSPTVTPTPTPMPPDIVAALAEADLLAGVLDRARIPAAASPLTAGELSGLEWVAACAAVQRRALSGEPEPSPTPSASAPTGSGSPVPTPTSTIPPFPDGPSALAAVQEALRSQVDTNLARAAAATREKALLWASLAAFRSAGRLGVPTVQPTRSPVPRPPVAASPSQAHEALLTTVYELVYAYTMLLATPHLSADGTARFNERLSFWESWRDDLVGRLRGPFPDGTPTPTPSSTGASPATAQPSASATATETVTPATASPSHTPTVPLASPGYQFKVPGTEAEATTWLGALEAAIVPHVGTWLASMSEPALVARGVGTLVASHTTGVSLGFPQVCWPGWV